MPEKIRRNMRGYALETYPRFHANIVLRQKEYSQTACGEDFRWKIEIKCVILLKYLFDGRIKERHMNDNYITLTIGKQKNIALIAHDNKKADLINWCEEHKEVLKNHFLCGTGTTARMITDKTELPVKGYNSGPLGGDQQIGAKIVEGKIDFVIFFSDPLTAQPHDPDVKALLRIAQVYDIPIANNRASADFMIKSEYMSQEYEHEVINFKKNIKERSETL